MPAQYLDILIEANPEDAWTFISLHGCPVELMAVMRELARLASIYEKSAKLEWTIFNTYPVDLLLEDVLNFKNDDEFTAKFDKELVDEERGAGIAPLLSSSFTRFIEEEIDWLRFNEFFRFIEGDWTILEEFPTDDDI